MQRVILATAVIIMCFAARCHDSTPGFTNNDKQVSPLVLAPLFPSPASGLSEQVVDLSSDTFSQKITIDTAYAIATKGGWYRMYDTDADYIDYKIVGNTQTGDFVLLARHVSNAFVQAEVFTLRLKDGKLYKISSFEPADILDYPVVINGNRVYMDSSVQKKQ